MISGMLSWFLSPLLIKPPPKEGLPSVVSSTAYNRQRPDLILMAVTSQAKPAASFGEVDVNQWKQSGLIKPSVIKPIVTTIEKGLVLKKLGRLAKEEQQILKDALQSILG